MQERLVFEKAPRKVKLLLLGLPCSEELSERAAHEAGDVAEGELVRVQQDVLRVGLDNHRRHVVQVVAEVGEQKWDVVLARPEKRNENSSVESFSEAEYIRITNLCSFS